MTNRELGMTHGFFALFVQKRMLELDIDTKTLAEAVGCTYENARKYVRGLAVPRTKATRLIATKLKLNAHDLIRRANADWALMKYGTVVWTVWGKNPEMGPIYINWEYLNDEDRKRVLQYAEFLKKKRKQERREMKAAAGHN